MANIKNSPSNQPKALQLLLRPGNELFGFIIGMIASVIFILVRFSNECKRITKIDEENIHHVNKRWIHTYLLIALTQKDAFSNISKDLGDVEDL